MAIINSSKIAWAEVDHPGWYQWVELMRSEKKTLLPHIWRMFREGWDASEDRHIDQAELDTVEGL